MSSAIWATVSQGQNGGSKARATSGQAAGLWSHPDRTRETQMKSGPNAARKPGADTEPLKPGWTTGQRQHKA